MKKTIFRVLALCIAASLMLSGCGVIDLGGYFQRLASGYFETVPFGDMEYLRPDMTAYQAKLDECIESAANETDVEVLMEKVMDFFGLYSDFSTQYALSYVHYCIDMMDTYWETEYAYCAQYSTTVDAGMDQLLYALADSPLRDELEQEDYFGEGYFDGYDGESVWDEGFTALMEQESQLQNEYYELSAQALEAEYYSDDYFTAYGTQLAELFVEMVALRQQIAQWAGYDSYPEFAYDFYYYRDYTAEDAATYVEQIREQLVPLYRELNEAGFWNVQTEYCTEEETFGYVKEMAFAMGGEIQEAFELMDEAGLYNIEFSDNKYSGSFETYLSDYWEPFVFLNPVGTVQDPLTFAHEFGHFCNDYVSWGSVAGVDVAEVFSQGMEYLSLCYADRMADAEVYKMADSLTVYVEQAAYAAFEQQVYGLTGEALTVENVQALYESVGTAYGFDTWDWDSRDYVIISHFFTNPMYIISYVVSNDAALQLYQLEQAEAGSGLACYTENLATEQQYFLAFLEEAGLESPFAQGRIQTVRETFDGVLR